MNQLSTVNRSNALTPRTMDEALRMAKILATSDIVPKDFRGKEGNCLVAIQFGMELNMPPMQALQNIMVVNGRPCIWGDLALALVRNSGLLEAIKETSEGMISATCIVKRRGEEAHTSVFTMQQAIKAGLSNKDIWKAYPERMLKMRARAFALRDVFADVLKGLRVREEVDDYDVTIEVQDRPPLMEPRMIQEPKPIETAPTQTLLSEDDRPLGQEKLFEKAGEPISEDQVKLFHVVKTHNEWKDAEAKAKLLEKFGFASSKDITTDKFQEILTFFNGGMPWQSKK